MTLERDLNCCWNFTNGLRIIFTGRSEPEILAQLKVDAFDVYCLCPANADLARGL